MRRRKRRGAALLGASALLAAGIVAGATPALAATAPGEPGANATWNESNVTGFADSLGSASKVWYTLGDGELENVFYPETDTPDTFGLQYIVTNGSSFASTETANTTHSISLVDPTSLVWQQVNTASNGDFTITKTYIADPSRSVILIQTTFDNLSSSPLQLYADYLPQLNNDGMGNTGGTDSTSGDLVASNGTVSSALTASTGFSQSSTGYVGTSSDGAAMLTSSYGLTSTYSSAPDRRAHRAGRADPGGGQRVDHVHPGAGLRLQPVGRDLRRGRVAGGRVQLAGELVRVRLAQLGQRAEQPARVGDRQQRAGAAVLRVADGAQGRRGQDLRRRVRRRARPTRGAPASARTAPAITATTWSGPGTSTRWPPPCWPPGTAPTPTPRCSTSSATRKSPAARSSRTRS